MELDDDVCLCFHVKKRKILNFLRIHKPRRASQLAECGSAGTGCGWCVPYLKRYFKQYEDGEQAEADSITAEDYSRARGDYIAEKKSGPKDS